MVKSYTAFTSEIDDVELAVSEILEQLEPEKNCLKNTVAVVTCYYEFAVNGIIAELYRKLKFPIIGTTTSALATNQGFGHLGLAVMMMTSDDVTFTAASSSSLLNDLEAPLTRMYQNALEGHAQTPKLILSAGPLLLNHAGDYYVDILGKASGGVPNYGTLAIDDTANFENSYTIFNDTFAKDMFCIIVASGNIHPKFFFSSISSEKILVHPALITKSAGNLLQEVNGRPLYDYLDAQGMVSNGKIRQGLNSLPLLLDRADGSQVISKVLIYLNEDGYGVCGGLMPEGSTMSIGVWDRDDVVATTLQTVERALSDENVSTLFMYSCYGRSLALGADIFAETDNVSEAVAGKVSYLFAYSGGEICPISGSANPNQFHNNTFVGCVF